MSGGQKCPTSTPTTALVAAITTGGDVPRQARPGGKWRARMGMTAAVSCLAVAGAPATRPFPRHFSKIFWLLVRLSQGLFRAHPSRRRVGEHGRQDETCRKISLSAGLGVPVSDVVAHMQRVLIGLSFAGGVEPNGSFAVACSSHLFPDAGFLAPTGTPASATDPGKEGSCTACCRDGVAVVAPSKSSRIGAPDPALRDFRSHKFPITCSSPNASPAGP